MILISFIITYHNEPQEFLLSCVRSILSLQLSSDEREVIVVDDGSRESAKACLHEIDSNIIYLRQENQGLSAARNRGIAEAGGRYLQFVDADDMLLRKTYNTFLAELRQSQPDMLMFRFTKDEASLQAGHPSLKRTNGISFLREKNMWASACCYVFRKERLAGLRFQTGILHEDELFTPQLILKCGVLLHTKSVAYFYRQRENTIMHKPDTMHIKKRLDDKRLVIAKLSSLTSGLSAEEGEGLLRRVYQLTMDYIYNVWNLTSSIAEVRRRVAELRQNGFFPLPLRFYTVKYFLFSLFTRFL